MGEHGQAEAVAKIAIVDDERDIVDYLSVALEDAGFRAIGITAAAGAIERIGEERPDLVVLDVMMPGRTGLSLYRALRAMEATREIPVVLISGYGRTDDLSLVVREPMASERRPAPEAYLEKPIAVETLLATVRRLLARDAAGCRAG